MIIREKDNMEKKPRKSIQLSDRLFICASKESLMVKFTINKHICMAVISRRKKILTVVVAACGNCWNSVADCWMVFFLSSSVGKHCAIVPALFTITTLRSDVTRPLFQNRHGCVTQWGNYRPSVRHKVGSWTRLAPSSVCRRDSFSLFAERRSYCEV